MIHLLRKLLRRPRYTESDRLAQERLAAKRLAARQWLASKRMGKRWIAAERSTFVAWNQEPEVRVVIPIRSIPTLRRVA